MNEDQMRSEFEAWFTSYFIPIDPADLAKGKEDEYLYDPALCAWEGWKAALASQAENVPPIERDEEMQRDYIPLPANWEIQTKGKGSTFRLAKTDGSDIRWPILEKMLHEPLEQMAREIHAAWLVSSQPTDDRVRELEKEVSLWKDRANQLSVVGDGQSMSDYWLKVDALILRNKGIQPEAIDQAMKEANQ